PLEHRPEAALPERDARERVGGDANAVRYRAGIRPDVARRRRVELERQHQAVVDRVHRDAVARHGVLSARLREQGVDVHCPEERVGERGRHGAERGAGVDRDRQPVELQPEVAGRGIAPDDVHLQPGGGGAAGREPAPRRVVSVAVANASGRRSRSTQRRSVFGPTAITWRSSPNSASNWRQAPHGDAGGSTSVATTMRLNPRAPSATAAPIAIRSAQIVSPYEALSTFAPTNTRPSAASSAAPTRNLLYGQYAFFCTSRARRTSSALTPRPRRGTTFPRQAAAPPHRSTRQRSLPCPRRWSARQGPPAAPAGPAPGSAPPHVSGPSMAWSGRSRGRR